MKKTTLLKKLISSSTTEFILEAHNGLSAKIVEEAGFMGIWASGLSISAAMGVRDNNEASWTQVLEVCEFMSDNTNIPILLDGDTGFGNFNNMRRLVKKLEQRNIAGVCIEDKLFPKTNSFISGEMQPLADVGEFCGKIKAAKDTQSDSDFIVVARTEAFIAGWGLQEALRRAEYYKEAGADAILVHSKKSNSSDIESFIKEWNNKHPIVIVPTKYYSTPTELFSQLGISLVIWANHLMRSSITSMQKNAKRIYENKNISCIQDNICSVAEIFRLQGAEELKIAEEKYLPSSGKKVNAVILAASQGDLGDLTKDIPKTLVKIKDDKSILSMQIESYNKVGIKDISVVSGFAKEKINFVNINSIDNEIYAETNELYSLYLAKEKFMDNTIISFGDIIFKEYILNDLLNDNSDISIVVDADYKKMGDNIDYIKADKDYSQFIWSDPVSLIEMTNELKENEIKGEFIGLWKMNSHGATQVIKALDVLSISKDFKKLTLCDLFNEVVKNSNINVKYIKGSWLDIDSIYDLHRSGEIK
ncbi:MAG: phosphoenolpyruvate mutase [Stygiobacter sp. RIFOXYC2_FULL_38_25]|nr:MAG: phosphoenolpyruvate mutase [Stygiobacter sp. RIFOXYC2_FULL_38_25]OGV17914.1 MAG: phosphoenolpyruvate mutase [Stygiobacter sp. RIFOXYA2_FULL_38_8]OGV79564.1 MAG: phosphoenolpyruvate mutase [Stygiobacter sp. GWF2_38_21]